MAFGNLTVKTSASQTMKLSNTGTADLAISQASVSGTGYGMSGLTAPVTVTAGASISFTVSFQPTTTGAAHGQHFDQQQCWQFSFEHSPQRDGRRFDPDSFRQSSQPGIRRRDSGRYGDPK